MSTKKRGFQGIVPLAKKLFYGAANNTPKVRRFVGETPQPNADGNTNYDGMKPDAYRWARQDETVRRCVFINAVYACLAAGFETEIEPLKKIKGDDELQAFQEKYGYVKDYVDAANKTVNMDYVLFVAQFNRSIYGKAGFEVIYTAGKPERIISHNPAKLYPIVSETTWEFEGVGYNNQQTSKWLAKDHNFLFFTNLALNSDMVGLSDVEPLYSICKARHNLLRKDLPEITASLWAPYAVLSADTDGMTGEEEDAFLDNLIESAKSGKSIAINKHVEATVVDRKINLTGLVALMDKLEECIIRNFGTPRFLVNKPTENRATAYTELEAYAGGTLASIQRYFKRELEAQWYAPLVQQALKGKLGAGEKVPLRVVHKWKPLRVTDVYQMASAVAALYNNDLGVLGGNLKRAYELMGWPIEEALKQIEEQEKQQTQQQDKPGDQTVGDKNQDADNK